MSIINRNQEKERKGLSQSEGFKPIPQAVLIIFFVLVSAVVQIVLAPFLFFMFLREQVKEPFDYIFADEAQRKWNDEKSNVGRRRLWYSGKAEENLGKVFKLINAEDGIVLAFGKIGAVEYEHPGLTFYDDYPFVNYRCEWYIDNSGPKDVSIQLSDMLTSLWYVEVAPEEMKNADRSRDYGRLFPEAVEKS